MRSMRDLIVRNIDWLISVDATRRVIRDAGVAIKGGQVRRGRQVRRHRARLAAPRRWSTGSGTVATPGMIDNHLHSSFQMSRGLADEANAQSFLFDHMYPYEGAMTEEDVYVSASLAAIELLRHGVTCFIDPGNYHPDATVRAIAASGLRMVVSRSCFDKTKSVMGLLPEQHDRNHRDCLAQTEELFDKYRDAYGGRVRPSASFRGLNNASDELILGLKGLAQKYGARLQTHACFCLLHARFDVVAVRQARDRAAGIARRAGRETCCWCTRAGSSRTSSRCWPSASRRWSRRPPPACTTATATSTSASCPS